MDKQPTEAEKKEFWEWCGIEQMQNNSPTVGADMTLIGDKMLLRELPALDLNNLFKYAVPKLAYTRLHYSAFMNEFAAEVYKDMGGIGYMKHGQDPAPALFWAIMEVIHANK
jgi:hypothetical protein